MFLLVSIRGENVLAQTDLWVHTNSPPGPAVTMLSVDAGGHFLAGSFKGGVYRSTDEGSIWVRADSGIVDTAVQTIGIGGDGLVFVGTLGGAGLYRSTDYGLSWNEVLFDTAGLPLVYVNAVYVDPHGEVFMSGGGYFYRSADEGLHWQRILEGFYAYSIVRNSDGILFAAGILFGVTMGVFRSSDNGDTWEDVNNGLADSVVTVVAVDSLGYVYAGTYGEGVFRSADNGQLWSRIDSGFINSYVQALAVGRTGDVYAGTTGSGVYRSTDNGDHWRTFSSGLSHPIVYQFALSSGGYLYAATIGGIYRTTSSTPVKRRQEGTPERFILEQNFPDPFNPSTAIRYWLPRESDVQLKIFDVLGREVTTLVDGRKPAGEYTIRWDAANVPGGMYFYRIVAGSWSGTKKMLIVR